MSKGVGKLELQELRILQALPLDIKILKTQQRIREWYDYWCGQVYVSFSGGKDSTVLLHLVRELYPDVQAVFCDTGLEFPEIRAFIKTIENVVWVKPKIGFKQVIEKYGYPVISKEQSQYIQEVRNCKSTQGINYNKRLNGNKWGRGKITNNWKFMLQAPFKISNMCCEVSKKKPMKLYEKETNNNPILGTMAEESQIRTRLYLQQGCNAFENKRPISQPISFWNESNIWDYIKFYNLPYSKIYDMGYERTGCMFCMFGVHLEQYPNRFQRMQRTHPKQWEYCINTLGLAKVLDYIHVSYTDNVKVYKDTNGQSYQQYKMIEGGTK